MRLYTTHKLLRAQIACTEGIERFTIREALESRGYGDDSILPLALILEINGLNDTLWALRAVPPEQSAERDRIARLFARDCAERVKETGHKRARTAARATKKRIAVEAATVASRAARCAAPDRQKEKEWQARRLMEYLQIPSF